MRLAYLTSQYPATSHTFIRREVAALREEGVAIHTMSVRPPAAGDIAGEAERAEADRTFYVLEQPLTAFIAAHIVIFVKHPLAYLRTAAVALSHRAPGVRGLLLGVAHFAESIVVARELRRHRIDHLHNHFANSAATVGLLATNLLGLGWSFTMHGISETDYPAGLLLPNKIRAAKMVVCVSWFGRAQGFRNVEPRQWSKFQVVRCGVPLAELPVRKTSGRSAKTIICVGRLSPEKGQAGLLQAFSEIQRHVPAARLLFVGDGPDREALAGLAQKLGVSQATTFAGRLGEAATLAEIALADVLVVASFMEGLPIVLMEAMALGVPVVASRVAGIPELVQDQANGLLFTPSDWDELATCVQRILDDESLYERVASNARATVEAGFDSRQSARQLAQLFSQVTERKQPPRPPPALGP